MTKASAERDIIAAKFRAMEATFNERSRRLWAGAEAKALGRGGDKIVSEATGLAPGTVRRGRRELASDLVDPERVRARGAGRPKIEDTQPGIKEALEALVDPVTRGDPTSPLRWTCKSKEQLAAALVKDGWKVSATKVGRMLHELGYSLQSVRKSREGTNHPDRNAQFEHINATATEYLAKGDPVISVDTKKKELVGDFKNAPRVAAAREARTGERPRLPDRRAREGDSVRHLRHGQERGLRFRRQGP